jgi:hypothetical protein
MTVSTSYILQYVILPLSFKKEVIANISEFIGQIIPQLINVNMITPESVC